MTGVLIKRREDRERETKGRWYGDTDTGRTPRDRRGPDWRDASTCQGTSRVAGSRQKLGGRYGTDSFWDPAYTSTWDFCPLNCQRINFCCVKLPT